MNDDVSELWGGRKAEKRPRGDKARSKVQEALKEILPGDHHWIAEPGDICRALSEEEVSSATRAATAEILSGKTPLPEDSGRSPHAVFAIGAPGSGKSTVAEGLVKMMELHPPESYVTLDYDLMIKYHPRLAELWHVPDMFGRPTDVGYGPGYWRCIGALDALGDIIFDDVVQKRYNVIVQTHAFEDIIGAQLHGYTVSLLYVAVSLEIAQGRARKRAVETGRFLAPNLTTQDSHIEHLWRRYRVMVPWYGLWADHFFVVNNDKGQALKTREDYAYINPHAEWPKSISTMVDAIAGAHGKK